MKPQLITEFPDTRQDSPGSWFGRGCLGAALLCLLPLTSLAATAQYRFDGVERVIAFGDVHGAYPALVELLQTLEVIDTTGRWRAGRTHLVSLGDLLDRGPDSRQVLDLLMDLQQQAVNEGGRLHLVLGNHEIMNLTGDLRYVSAAEYAAFAMEESAREREQAQLSLIRGRPELADRATFDSLYPPGFFAHRRAFAADGIYGRWLLEQPLMVVINDIAFVHGGLPPWLAGIELDALNKAMLSETTQLLELGDELVAQGVLPPWQDLINAQSTAPESDTWERLRHSELFGSNSPNWYRGTANCHRLLEEPVLAAALASLKATRVVVGHTPTSDRRIQSRFDGRAILADTGLLARYYRGRSSAVIFAGDGMQLVYPGESDPPVAMSTPPVDARTGTQPALVEQLERLDIEDLTAGEPASAELPTGRFSVLFEAGSSRQVRNRLAAYRLDQLLGLGLVAVTVERNLGNRRGTLSLLPHDSIDEVVRQQTGQARTNWCGTGDDYQLMYAFDTLIGNELRRAEQMHYDTTHWLLYLTGHDQAFGTSLDAPAYLKGREFEIPTGLHQRLDALFGADARTELDAALGELLSKRQLRALSERARLLLSRSNTGG